MKTHVFKHHLYCHLSHNWHNNTKDYYIFFVSTTYSFKSFVLKFKQNNFIFIVITI